jgi:hypothetical protein
MAAAARFYNARLKSGRASPSALASTFAPSLAYRSLSPVRPRASGVGAWARGCLAEDGAPAARCFPHGVAPASDQLQGRQRSGLPVAGLRVLPELPVEVGQLLIEACPTLGVGGAVMWRWLRVEAA